MMSAILFYLTLIVFIAGQIGRISSTNGFVVQLLDVFVICTSGTWFIGKILRKDLLSLKEYSLTKPLLFFTGVSFISLLLSPIRLQIIEYFISGLYIIRWVSYAALCLVVADFGKETKKKIQSFFVYSGFITVIIGYIQYFYYPNLRNLFYLGWDDHLFRLFSVFFDPNFAATIFCLILFSLLPSVIGKSFNYSKNVWIARCLFVLTFIALLLTYSRSGYLMFGVGAMVGLWLMQKRKLIIAFISVLLLGIILLPKDLGSSGVELWRTASIFARTESVKQALIIIGDHPILGVGFNTFRYAQRQYGFEKSDTWEQSHSAAGTDNSFLFVLATTGLTGLMAFLYLWFIIIKTSFHLVIKKKHDTQRTMHVIVLMMIAGLFVNAFFINSLFYPHVMFWFWSMYGLVQRRDEKTTASK